MSKKDTPSAKAAATRSFLLSLGTHDAERRRKALDDLAEQVGSIGQRGPGYTKLNIDLAEAFEREPELAAALVGCVTMLQAVELSPEDRDYLLSQARGLKAQIVSMTDRPD